MPWFLVGTATKDYDVPYRKGRSFFCASMVSAAANHINHFIKRYISCENILCWDICDEPEFYCRQQGADQWPYDRDAVRFWVDTIYRTIKRTDTNHLVTLGFGHIATENFGMHIRDMADILDTMVVTAYPNGLREESCTALRSNYFMQYHVRFNDLGKNVFTCEAPGYSNVIFSKRAVGDYFKVSLYSNLVNKSKGVLPWVFNDFEKSLWSQVPLNESTFEPFFGIIENNGDLKPSGRELKAFAKWSKDKNITDYFTADAQTAIYVPRNYYGSIENAFPDLYHTFIYLKGCQLDLDFVWEDQDLSKYRLIVISSSAGMTSGNWEALKDYVENGGNIVWIFDERTGLSAYTNDLFGIETQAVEGDFGYDTYLCSKDFGSFADGATGKLLGAERRSYLKVEAGAADVILKNVHNSSPLLTKHHLGSGNAWLVTQSLQRDLFNMETENYMRNPLYHMLGDISLAAGIEKHVVFDNCAVEYGELTHMEDGNKIIIFINHDQKPQKVSADFTCLVTMGYDIQPEMTIELEASGVHVMEVKTRDAKGLCGV